MGDSKRTTQQDVPINVVLFPEFLVCFILSMLFIQNLSLAIMFMRSCGKTVKVRMGILHNSEFG